MSNKNKRLQELRGSDFEVAKGQPDIRGWEVRDQSGHLIGKVSELIFDSRAHKVRYMVVNVTDSKELQLEKRIVLVPIGLAVLQAKDNDVILENVTPFQLRALPKYTTDDLGTRAELAISEVFGRKYTQGVSSDADADLSDEFYEHEQFDEKKMYRNRGNQNTGSTLQSNNSAQSRSTISEAEADSLRRDTELKPLTTPDTDTTSIRDRELPQQKGESDEDYIRRSRRNK
jgi:sporulation protein YlmC with PRC-barrel domain